MFKNSSTDVQHSTVFNAQALLSTAFCWNTKHCKKLWCTCEVRAPTSSHLVRYGRDQDGRIAWQSRQRTSRIHPHSSPWKRKHSKDVLWLVNKREKAARTTSGKTNLLLMIMIMIIIMIMIMKLIIMMNIIMMMMIKMLTWHWVALYPFHSSCPTPTTFQTRDHSTRPWGWSSWWWGEGGCQFWWWRGRWWWCSPPPGISQPD